MGETLKDKHNHKPCALQTALQLATSMLRLSKAIIEMQHKEFEAAREAAQMVQDNNRELWHAMERIQVVIMENGPVGILPDLEAEPDPAVISEHICKAIMEWKRQQ